ncbi:MAG: hypothetical protein PHV20_09930 [Bacteroidales bacterium]|nr:hypothetical protein [Bacteroidales bacterium]
MKRKIFSLSLTLLLGLFSWTATAATGWYSDFIKLNVNEAGVTPPTGYKWIGSDPAYGSSFVAGLGNVTSLKLDGADMKYWSDTQDRTGGSFFYEVKSADNVTTYIAATEVIWTQTALGGNDFQGVSSGLNVDLLAGIPAGTACKVTVWAKSWGTGQGDSWLTNGGANYVATFTKASVAITGAAVIADGTSYTTLKLAFDAINTNAASQSGKNIAVKIYDNTTEASLVTLNAGTWTSLTVYPTVSGKTITSSLASNIITISGSNVTFDGRVNQTGARDLSITNTLASTSTPYTFLIQEPTGATGLSNVTVKYCTISANNTSSGKGNVTVTFTATPTVAMSNINIQNNLITGRCAYSVYAKGVSAALPTTGLTISNNELKNCFLLSAAATAIIVDASHTGATISGNSIYDDSAPFTPTGGFAYTGITVSGGGGHTISGNFIGGNAASCSGTLTKVSTTNNTFNGIILTTSGTGSASSVQNNKIKGLTWPNSGTASWLGITAAGTNDINIGTTTGNTIGGTTGNDSIIITNVGAATTTAMSITTSGTTNCQNNKIGAIKAQPNGTSGTNIVGIQKSASAGTTTISNNVIGSGSTANSINNTSGLTQYIYGILSQGTGSVTISGNTIANMTNTTTTGNVYAIYQNGAASTLAANKNLIHSLEVTSTSTAANVVGIYCNAGTNTVSNNIITLKGNNPTTLSGLVETTGSVNTSFYHNTVSLGGTPTTLALQSKCISTTGVANIRNIKNNILANARSNGGTASGAHYAISMATNTTGTLTIDGNDYVSTGTGGVLGAYGGSRADIVAMRTATGQDVSSVSVSPSFANVNGTTAVDFKSIGILGVSGTGISTDFDGTSRVNVTMGAYEIAPVLTVSPSSLDNLNYTTGAGPAHFLHSFDVSGGTSLSGDITITAPTNFEVSKTGVTSEFTPSVTVAPTSGSVSATPIYVRLVAGLSANTYTGDVTVSAAGAVNKTVACTGVVDITVDLKPSTLGINIYTNNGIINVDGLAAGQIIELYNGVGQKISSKVATEGVNQINTLNKGIQIVKIGNLVKKVVVK